MPRLARTDPFTTSRARASLVRPTARPCQPRGRSPTLAHASPCIAAHPSDTPVPGGGRWRPLASARSVNIFDVAAILVAAAATFGYVNHRFLHLPSTTGTLLVALVSSIAVVLVGQIIPAFDIRPTIERFLGGIDFDQTLMHGFL